jgi:hypothetical protein
MSKRETTNKKVTVHKQQKYHVIANNATENWSIQGQNENTKRKKNDYRLQYLT